MKKLLSTLALLSALAPGWAAAQTKEETEKWISAQAPESYSLGIKYTIEGGEWSRSMRPITSIGSSDRYKNTIQIKDITTVTFLHTDKFMSFRFTCPDECVYSVTTTSSDKFVSDKKGNAFLFEIYEKLDASMLPRMQKAILHLIELNGGKAKMVAYQKPKEAF